MRVAITGASGFIGTHLVTALGARGHTAVPVKREAAGELVSPHEGERAEALVHLAFPTDAGARRADPVATLQAVVRGAAKAVAIAEQLGASHLVLASTGKVFGSPDRLPIADDDHAQPTTQLGLLKRLAEEIFACAARRSEVGVTSLRIFNAYGPGQTGAFLIPAITDGASSTWASSITRETGSTSRTSLTRSPPPSKCLLLARTSGRGMSGAARLTARVRFWRCFESPAPRSQHPE